MEKILARIFSYIFHPLLVPTYTMAILLNMQAYFALIIPEEAKWRLIGIVFLVTFVFPGILSYFFLRTGIINSFEMETRQERVFPLLITAIFFYLNYYLINGVEISPVYAYFAIGATSLVIVTLLINFFWKISMHMVAMGALFGTLLGISLALYVSIPKLIFASVIIAGLTGFARLKLSAHDPAQIYTGFLTGAIVMLVFFLAV